MELQKGVPPVAGPFLFSSILFLFFKYVVGNGEMSEKCVNRKVKLFSLLVLRSCSPSKNAFTFILPIGYLAVSSILGSLWLTLRLNH